MLIEYKTILMGEKALELNQNKNDDGYQIDGITGYGIVKIEYCCEDIKDWIRNGIDPPKFAYENYEPYFSVHYGYGGEAEFYEINIYYCPFCGKKIIYQEIQKVRLKARKKEKIEYTDYYEEEIK